MKTWKRVLIILAGLLLLFCLVGLGLVWYVGSSVFAKTPGIDGAQAPPDAATMGRVGFIANTMVNEMMVAKPGQISNVELERGEVQVLALMAANYLNLRIKAMAMGSEGMWDAEDAVAINFDGQAFQFNLAKKVDFWNPWGKYVNFGVSLTPTVKDGEPSFVIHHVKGGGFSLPRELMSSKVDGLFDGEEMDIMAKLDPQVREVLVDLWIEDEKLKANYRPHVLRQILDPYLQNFNSTTLMQLLY